MLNNAININSYREQCTPISGTGTGFRNSFPLSFIWTLAGCRGVYRQRVVCLFMFSALVSITPYAALGDTDLNEQFLRQYEPGAEKLVDAYGKAIIKATRTDEGFPNQEEKKSQEITYMANGQSMRLEVANAAVPNNDVSERVWVAQPRYSFTLARRGNKPFAITALEHRYEDQVQRLRLHGVIPFISYCFFELTFAEFVRAREFNVKVEKLTRDAIGGLPVVKVNYSSIIPANPENNMPKPFHRVGEWVFLPDHYWALKEHSFGSPSFPNAARVSIDYEIQGAVPVIKRIQQWRQHEDGHRTNRTTIEVKEISFQEVDPAEFSLTAFGFPDALARQRKGRQAYLWVGLAGIVCVLFGMYLRARKSKFRKSS